MKKITVPCFLCKKPIRTEDDGFSKVWHQKCGQPKIEDLFIGQKRMMEILKAEQEAKK